MWRVGYSFGMFLLIYNVMKISMNRDIQQMGLLYTIGTTKRQIKGFISADSGDPAAGSFAGQSFFGDDLVPSDSGNSGKQVFKRIWRLRRVPGIFSCNFVGRGWFCDDSYAWNGVACDPPCSQHILRGEQHSHLRNPSTFKKEGEFEEADKNRRNRLYGMAEM